jgi:hypothetical protein
MNQYNMDFRIGWIDEGKIGAVAKHFIDVHAAIGNKRQQWKRHFTHFGSALAQIQNSQARRAIALRRVH